VSEENEEAIFVDGPLRGKYVDVPLPENSDLHRTEISDLYGHPCCSGTASALIRWMAPPTSIAASPSERYICVRASAVVYGDHSS
jgi:hypothetical protein